MVHFLRNHKNRTIIECEVYNNDLHNSIDIQIYSIELLQSKDFFKFIDTFSSLNQIRRIWWESDPHGSLDEEINKFVEEYYKNIAETYSYNYVID